MISQAVAEALNLQSPSSQLYGVGTEIKNGNVFATFSITSAAAATAVNIIPDSAIPAGKKFYLTEFTGKVNGATAWATTATVKIQDTNGTAVDHVTIPVASMTANAVVDRSSTVTKENAFSMATGGTAGKGVQIKGNANGTGSTFVGWIQGVIQ